MKLEEVENVLVNSGLNKSLKLGNIDLQKVSYNILKYREGGNGIYISGLRLTLFHIKEALEIIIQTISGRLYYILDSLHKWKYFIKKDVCLIKAGSIVDRFKDKSNKIFNSISFIELSFLTKSNFLKSFKLFFNNDINYIPVYHLTISGILSLYKYFVEYRKPFFNGLDGLNSYQKYSIELYLIKMLLYRSWADSYAQVIVRRFQAKVYIFDVDQDRKFQMLADALNKLGQQTVLLQHGILTNPYLYIPTCRYMLCCSEREKKALIKSGIEPFRLKVIGSPVQTIIPEKFKLVPSTFKNKFLIIASGRISTQKTSYYIETINSVNYKEYKTVVRLHPRSSNEIDQLWKKSFNDYAFDNYSDIFEQIQHSEIIITCSLDALIKCLYLRKPTICVLTKEEYGSDKLSFLKDISGLPISYDSKSHQENLNKIMDPDCRSGIAKKELLYNFGENDIQKVSKNITSALMNIFESR
ncbi:hypothetical protein [Rhodohalobacter mucosus]|uniref:Uncharacterized protein n=1 Tax=Rhodohalobacter mucosus TaxID=2079485 RepID=A0A316TS57_9BACT|nr:hypothetical protein [Rhodohalobacter mucosus]PWN07463.1 hypothetical protein DDZ15_04155 [Rhodohalobacter mucosus]